jgi:hypothetical protein
MARKSTARFCAWGRNASREATRAGDAAESPSSWRPVLGCPGRENRTRCISGNSDPAEDAKALVFGREVNNGRRLGLPATGRAQGATAPELSRLRGWMSARFSSGAVACPARNPFGDLTGEPLPASRIIRHTISIQYPQSANIRRSCRGFSAPFACLQCHRKRTSFSPATCGRRCL